MGAHERTHARTHVRMHANSNLDDSDIDDWDIDDSDIDDSDIDDSDDIDESDFRGTLPQPTMVMKSTTQTCGTVERSKRQWKELSDNGKN